MALGTITYTSVTWTAGDTITEAKLDNMVANDQAYDAHAAQGLQLNDNRELSWVSGAKIERDTGHIVLTPEPGKQILPQTQCGFLVYLSADQTVATATTTTVQFDTEIKDSGGVFDNTTYTFTAPVQGFYIFTLKVGFLSVSAGTDLQVHLDVDATEYRKVVEAQAGTNQITHSLILHLAAGAAVKAEVRHNEGADLSVEGGGGGVGYPTIFGGHLLSKTV